LKRFLIGSALEGLLTRVVFESAINMGFGSEIYCFFKKEEDSVIFGTYLLINKKK
jgi:hypothetical protein